MTGYDKISVGSNVKQQLDNDMGLKMTALTILRPGIRTCMEAADDASRELLEHILVDEEKHVNWVEAQLHQINEICTQHYLAQQIKEN